MVVRLAIRTALAAMVLSTSLATIASAQSASPDCPTVSVSCPDGVAVGAPITYTANVSGGDPNLSLTFNWSVSTGTIGSGQGTSSITLDSSGLADGTSITATVELGGAARKCPITASCTTAVKAEPEAKRVEEPDPSRIHEFARGTP